LRRPQLHFVSVPDAGSLPEDVLEARRAREAVSLRRFLQDTAAMKTARDFHAWMHSTHLCYAVERQHEFGQTGIANTAVLASY
jgi:hypothetical protein